MELLLSRAWMGRLFGKGFGLVICNGTVAISLGFHGWAALIWKLTPVGDTGKY